MGMFTFFLREVKADRLLATFSDGCLRRTIAIYFFAATLLFKASLEANAYEALLEQLGFSLHATGEGFSRQGNARPFDVESPLNALRRLAPDQLTDWYIAKVIPFTRQHFPWPPRFLILDTLRIAVDAEAKRPWPGASWGYLRTENGKEITGFGYQLIVLAYPIGKKRCGVLAAQLFGLGEAEIDCGRGLISRVLAAYACLLRALHMLMDLDRAFLNAARLTSLKRKHGLHPVLPISEKTDLLDSVRALLRHEKTPASARGGHGLPTTAPPPGRVSW